MADSVHQVVDREEWRALVMATGTHCVLTDLRRRRNVEGIEPKSNEEQEIKTGYLQYKRRVENNHLGRGHCITRL